VGILYEILVAVGVALMLVITCSVEIMGREYMQSGHISLAQADRPHCVGIACGVPLRSGRSGAIHARF
jgi:hypothetical protein